MTVEQGWDEVPLSGLVADGPSNGVSPKSGPDARGARTLRLSATTSGRLVLNEQTTKRVYDEYAADSKFWLEPGDLLLQRANTIEYVGTAAVYEGPPSSYIYPDLMMRIRVNGRVDVRYLWRYLSTNRARKYFRDNATGTAGNMPKVNGSIVRALPVPLPPLDQQRRIVEKIEALTAKSRRAKEALDAIPPLLERFRQSVLAAAFRGDLTKDWREQNPDVEPADQLLARIRRERRARWEQAELEKLRAKGKVPKGEDWKKKYEPAAAPEFLNRAAPLPRTWTWASVADVSECLDSMRVPVTRTDRRAGPYPYYGANGQVDSIDKYIYDEPLVLVTEDETFFGRTKPIAYRVSGKCWVNNHAHVLRPIPPFETAFLCMSLMHYPVIPWLSGTTGRAKLTQGALNRLPIALPPAAEALEITRRVERSLRLEEVLGPELGAARSLLTSLDAAILAKAFRGELDLLNDERRAAQSP